MADALRALLKAQHDEHLRLKQAGEIEPCVLPDGSKVRRVRCPEADP